MRRDAGLRDDDSGCPPTWETGTEATAYQIDPSHSGAQPDDRLTLPLCERWRRDLGGAPGYPLVSGGLVYVATSGSVGKQLWALDQYTGATRWGPMSLTGSYFWAALSSWNGTVYALTASGVLTAYDAATGAQRWIAQLGNSDAPPTATADGVFVSAHLTLHSRDPATGSSRWSRAVVNGDTSSPAVRGDLVTASYACNRAYGFSLAGVQRWSATSSCSGGGGKTTAIYRDRVYTRDSMGDLVLSAMTGQLLGSYGSRYIPAFSQDVGYYTPNTTLQAVSLSTGSQLWTGPQGVAAPVVVGGHVVLATSSAVVVLDALTGVEVSRQPLLGIRGTDEQNVSGPIAGLAAANGMLFVPTATALVAY